MPQYSNNILSLTTTELELCGVSKGYLKRALAGQRKGEVYCWEHHKIGRNVYIHYDALLDKYKDVIREQLCNGVEPAVYLKDKEENKQQSQLTAIANQLPSLVSIKTEDLDSLINTGLYTATEAQQLARAGAWLHLLNEYDTKRVRSLGYKSVNDFREEVFKHCLNEQDAQPFPLIKWKKGNITNLRVLLRNARKYEQVGIQALIHKGVGNVNREKADTVAHAKMVELYSNPVKYSYEDTAMMYNDWAEENGKELMTTSAIKAYLNIPKVKKVWYYKRHGKLAADNDLQQIISRRTPSFPDALWSIDGTTMQLYYRDNNDKVRSDLYVYFVTDACTGAIIGHSVAFAETQEMVMEALKNTLYTHENKPYQLQYDNSSANIANAVQCMMSNMSRVHFPCEPYKGRGKYVESIIGHFQQQVLRKRENFKGGNVDVRSLNSKANPELLKEISKTEGALPTFTEVLNEFEQAVTEWNNRGEKRNQYGRFVGDSKIYKYENIQHEKRAKLNYFDKLSLFNITLRKPYKYTTEGVKFEINGQKLKYIVPDPDSVGDFIFANEHLGEEFDIKINLENTQICSLYKKGKLVAYAYEKEKYAACVADMKDGEKAKVVLFKQKREEWGAEYAHRELERQMLLLEEYKATGTDGFGWWDRSKLATNNINNQQEDIRNGMADGYTDLERKILKIGQ